MLVESCGAGERRWDRRQAKGLDKEDLDVEDGEWPSYRSVPLLLGSLDMDC